MNHYYILYIVCVYIHIWKTVFLVWICTVRTFLFLFCCLHPTVLTSLVDMFSYWKGDDFRVSLRVSGSEKSSWSASCGCPEVHRRWKWPMEILVPWEDWWHVSLQAHHQAHHRPVLRQLESPGEQLKKFHVEQIWRQRKFRFSWHVMNIIFDCKVLERCWSMKII